jgi:hypothetical protein
MAGNEWNPWKLTAIGMALVIITALVTGLVVAQWSGRPVERHAAAPELSKTEPAPAARRAESAVPTPVRRPTAAPPAPSVAAPTQTTIDACHQYAAAQVGQRDKTVAVVKDGAIGAAVGAAVGAAGGAIAGGGSGAGKGAAIGGILGAGGGSLYGLNDNQKHDQQYREAYSACMRSRGHVG